MNELGIIAPRCKTPDPDARAQCLAIALPPGSTFPSLLRDTGYKAGAELAPYAQAIPLLEFLIEDRIETVALSPNHVIPINAPSPERFAFHKIYSSQSRRTSDRAKISKDLGQAAVLAAAIEEETPGRLVEVFRAMPKSGKPAIKRAAPAVSKLLHDSHEEARAALGMIAGR